MFDNITGFNVLMNLRNQEDEDRFRLLWSMRSQRVDSTLRNSNNNTYALYISMMLPAGFLQKIFQKADKVPLCSPRIVKFFFIIMNRLGFLLNRFSV